MASQVDIANIALSNLGEQPISSLTEANQRARACEGRFNDVRDMVLRSHLWNCAMTRVQLVADGTAPVWGYNYKYPLPADCLRVIAVKDVEYSWKIEGGYIVSDDGSMYIVYVRKEENPEVYDALLVQAMGCRLAAECAQDITGKTALKDSMMAKYLAVLSEARSADAAEGTPQKIESDLWLESRYTSIDSWRPFSADVVQDNAY